MKQLIKCTGPRDMSLVEFTLRIANLAYQYQKDRKVFEDTAHTFEDRQAAYTRMVRAQSMLESYKGVRRDILKKEGGVPQRKVPVS
ncbi:MAG: hypothetical protein JXQ30_12905 [Spirochaetes bacterium]|nr:hypothetical protein [Spirochaetota bacterium]